MAVPLKYLSNFWRNDEMPWINCGIILQLTWSANCLITDSIGAEIFAVTDTKLYFPVVTLLTLDNTELLEKLKSWPQWIISWNKLFRNKTYNQQNLYLNCFIDPSFQRVNRLLVLLFENGAGRTGHTHTETERDRERTFSKGRNRR